MHAANVPLLRSPLCLLRNVQMVVFRAHYQVPPCQPVSLHSLPCLSPNLPHFGELVCHLQLVCHFQLAVLMLSQRSPSPALPQFGEPIYPPAFVSFQAGPAPWSLAPPTLKFPVAASGAHCGCSCGVIDFNCVFSLCILRCTAPRDQPLSTR